MTGIERTLEILVEAVVRTLKSLDEEIPISKNSNGNGICSYSEGGLCPFYERVGMKPTRLDCYICRK